MSIKVRKKKIEMGKRRQEYMESSSWWAHYILLWIGAEKMIVASNNDKQLHNNNNNNMNSRRTEHNKAHNGNHFAWTTSTLTFKWIFFCTWYAKTWIEWKLNLKIELLMLRSDPSDRTVLFFLHFISNWKPKKTK